jgi:zinc protease
MTSKKQPSRVPNDFTHLHSEGGFSEYQLKHNGLRVLHHEIKGTGVISSNITYKVGARDEGRGETGIAHMLEHMMFKPTRHDIARGTDSAAMKFGREYGVVLNANTWKDRTTYFFSYPKSLFRDALTIEAERMRDLVIDDAEFQPERTNVLSEYDMYNGHPEFALEVGLCTTALISHPYGHETIGFREDIAGYTVEMLQRFYDRYYQPNNATITIVGDVPLVDALTMVAATFSSIKAGAPITRHYPIEPMQEGLRRFYIERNSSTNMIAFGCKHDRITTKNWLHTMIALRVLTHGADSILHEKLVNTGKVTDVRSSIEPTNEPNVASLSVTLSNGSRHDTIEANVLSIMNALTIADVTPLLKKNISYLINSEAFDRDSSLKIALDLTEYVSADAWPLYLRTSEQLKSITAKDVLTCIKQMGQLSTLTIGHFIGTKR